jgi:hypothetical protein
MAACGSTDTDGPGAGRVGGCVKGSPAERMAVDSAAPLVNGNPISGTGRGSSYWATLDGSYWATLDGSYWAVTIGSYGPPKARAPLEMEKSCRGGDRSSMWSGTSTGLGSAPV